MRILFYAPPLQGHLHPMVALARKLESRGHSIVFTSFPDGETSIRSAGLAFLPFCADRFPAGAVAGRLAALSTLTGEEGFSYMVRVLAEFCDTELEYGARTFQQSGADAAVLDFVAAGLGLVMCSEKIPYVHICTSMHFDLSGRTPLCLYDWAHDSTPEALDRNAAGAANFAKLYRPVSSRLRAFARLHSLSNPKDHKDFSGPELALISQVPREFDFPGVGVPANFHYTGPFQYDVGRPYIDFPWYRLTGEPIIYASMGTLQNGSEKTFRTIAEAAMAPGRQLILAVGSNVDAARFTYPSERAIVTRYAPQTEILKRAALCITHGGLNTVLESLSSAVPLIVIPITNDQPGIAMRVAYTGTGVGVPLQQLTVNNLRNAIDTILGGPAFHENARRLQAAIKRTDGLSLASDIIEYSFKHAGQKNLPATSKVS